MRHSTSWWAARVLVLLVLPLVPARLLGQHALGAIDFPTSGSVAAQPHFIRGVLFLHSFEYDDAAEAFREAQRLDSGFAMAYWGEAVTYTHPMWNQQDRDAARAVLERLGPTPDTRRAKAATPREKAYLDAIEILYGEGSKASRDTSYSAAMERLASTYPDDLEAKAFYALSLLGLSQGNRDIPTYMRAAAVADEVFDKNPNHPGGAHYAIHAFDDPIHAPLGLRAARAYSKIAPDAAHAQHMTSHIFVAMGMWQDVVAANEVAWEVSGRRNGHYTSWLEYGYLQQGRYSHALKFLEDIREDAERNGSAPTRNYLAAMRARYIIDARDWAGPAARIPVDTAGLPYAATRVAFSDGISAAMRGDRSAAEVALTAMESGRRTLVARVEGDPPVELGHAEIMERSLRAVLLKLGGRTDEALAELARAVALEETLPFEFGPPVTVKPPRELLGEMLLESNRPAEAKREFELALARTPRRVQALLGFARAAAATGETERAVRAYQELRNIWHRAERYAVELGEAERYLAEHDLAQTGAQEKKR